jgi:hypothetical protein
MTEISATRTDTLALLMAPKNETSATAWPRHLDTSTPRHPPLPVASPVSVRTFLSHFTADINMGQP